MKNEALRLAIKAMKSFQDGTNGLYKGEFDEEIAKCEKALAQSAQEQALLDSIVGGTGVMLGDKRIDPASIYKQPVQQPVQEKKFYPAQYPAMHGTIYDSP